MSKVDTILDEIKGLTLLEASDLVKKMEEAFGVSAAAATVGAGGGGGGGGRARRGVEERCYCGLPPGRGAENNRPQPGWAGHQRRPVKKQRHGPAPGTTHERAPDQRK